MLVQPNSGTQARSRRPRVLLADTERLMLDGLRLILEPEYDIVAAVTEGSVLLVEALRLRPDVALIDVLLPPDGGIEIAQRLRELMPATKVLFIAVDSDLEKQIGGMWREGAGYVLRRCAAGEVRSAVKDVVNGCQYVTPSLKKQVAQAFQARPVHAVTELTSRERDVLRLVAEGLAARDIANLLNITAKTVAFHKTNIKHKLGVRTTAALTRYAVREGVVS